MPPRAHRGLPLSLFPGGRAPSPGPALPASRPHPRSPTLTLLSPLNPFQTEDEYYAAEWTPDERAAGLHQSALRFAHEASIHGGSQHGSRHGKSGMGSRAQSKVSLASLGKPATPGDDSARAGRVDGGVAKV